MNIRRRLVFLAISIVIVVGLFLVSAKREADEDKLPTPTLNEVTIETESVAEVEITNTNEPTVTLAPTLTKTPNDQEATAQAIVAKATIDSISMNRMLDMLLRDGLISSREGTYVGLKDFENTLAKSGWYKKWNTNVEAYEFILRADVAWEIGHEEDLSLPHSGCGFVFSQANEQYMFRVFLNLDGIVRLHRMLNGEFEILAAEYYGEMDPFDDYAQLTLIVQDQHIKFLVNNYLIIDIEDSNYTEGDVLYAIASGQNYNYGVRCIMENVEMWKFK